LIFREAFVPAYINFRVNSFCTAFKEIIIKMKILLVSGPALLHIVLYTITYIISFALVVKVGLNEV